MLNCESLAAFQSRLGAPNEWYIKRIECFRGNFFFSSSSKHCAFRGMRERWIGAIRCRKSGLIINRMYLEIFIRLALRAFSGYFIIYRGENLRATIAWTNARCPALRLRAYCDIRSSWASTEPAKSRRRVSRACVCVHNY